MPDPMLTIISLLVQSSIQHHTVTQPPKLLDSDYGGMPDPMLTISLLVQSSIQHHLVTQHLHWAHFHGCAYRPVNSVLALCRRRINIGVHMHISKNSLLTHEVRLT